jgi:hypothetical protein
MVDRGVSQDTIAILENELKVAVDEKAKAALRLDSERRRLAAVEHQLNQARQAIASLWLAEAFQTRTGLLAEAEELIRASRAEAKRQALAIVDAGREEARALRDDSARRRDALDAVHQELTETLAVMKILCDELRATCNLVAQTAIAKAVENTREELERCETSHRLAEPNSEPAGPGPAPQDGRVMNTEQAQAPPTPQGIGWVGDRSVPDVRAAISMEQDQLEPSLQQLSPSVDHRRGELAVIIDDRDRGPRRSRYQKRLNLHRRNLGPRKRRARQDEAIAARFARVLSTASSAESTDPREVEARLRNLSHGTNGE